MMRVVMILLGFLWLTISVSVNAQGDCGVVDSFSYPVDTTVFRLAQGFGVASPRHQGRFHTGEDWYGGPDYVTGTPVRAAARGRVTYSYTLGWGRDGGVVIIQHTFPDGTTAYSVYGHIVESDTVTFPRRLDCVEAGDSVGVIADARPAPHVHFEIRVNQPDTPGPGYTYEDPVSLGYRSPTRFVANLQTWLTPAHRWHVTLDGGRDAERGPYSPPLVLSDNSLLMLNGDGSTLRRILPDGRILWRKNFETPAVSVSGFQGTGLLTFSDGTQQTIDADGNMGDSWRLDVRLRAPLYPVANWLIYQNDNAELIALNPARRTVDWQVDNIPSVQRLDIIGDDAAAMLGIVTGDDRLVMAQAGGERLVDVALSDSASLTGDNAGGYFVYNWGGYWRVGEDGRWSLALSDAPRGGQSSAALTLPDDSTILFDGAQIHRFDAMGAPVWSLPLGVAVSGQVRLSLVDDVLLLISSDGVISAIAQSGVVCNRTTIYGRSDARIWHNLAGDTLQIAIADQVLGLDWPRFSRGCRSL